MNGQQPVQYRGFLAAIDEQIMPSDVPNDLATTNKLLMVLLKTTKLMAAALGASENRDSRTIDVASGTTATKLLKVDDGDLYLVIMHNWDRVQAKPIYYAQNNDQVKPAGSSMAVNANGTSGVGMPLNAGETRSIVVKKDLYAILDVSATVAVTVHLEICRIWTQRNAR